MIGLVRHRQRWFFALGAFVLLGTGTGVLLFGRQPSAARPAQLPTVTPLRKAPDPMLAQRTKGKESAPITVYEMSDFQCPFCQRQALETLPALEKEFIETGKIKWVFINLPLTDIHPNAAAAHEFAMCAAKADKFWPVHDLLFTYQKKWAPLKDPGPFLLSLADSVGLSRDEITPCLESGEMRALVQGEAEGANKNGIAKTPTAYIEGAGLVPGAQPLELYRMVLDSLYKERTSK